jgi:hypothetical protein
VKWKTFLVVLGIVAATCVAYRLGTTIYNEAYNGAGVGGGIRVDVVCLEGVSYYRSEGGLAIKLTQDGAVDLCGPLAQGVNDGR